MTPRRLWEGLSLLRSERVVYLGADPAVAVLSSAIVGAELSSTRHILNMRVDKDYASLTPWEDLRSAAHGLGIREPFVGLMTAARLDATQVVFEQESNAVVVAIVSVGLTHPVAAGITQVAGSRTGTINMILVVDARLSPAARVNAVMTATEAKALALVEAGIRAPHGGPAGGTGTDAAVIASTERGPAFDFAGPVSPLGAMIGRAVRRSIQQSLSE